MPRSLLALALLAAPAFADGSVYLSAYDWIIDLDDPPPGATRLEFRVDWQLHFNVGLANNSLAWDTVWARYCHSLRFWNRHGEMVAQDRTFSRAWDYLAPGRGGWSGCVGPGTSQQLLTGHRSSPVFTVQGTPDELWMTRHALLASWHGYSCVMGGYYENWPTATVTWAWK